MLSAIGILLVVLHILKVGNHKKEWHDWRGFNRKAIHLKEVISNESHDFVGLARY